MDRKRYWSDREYREKRKEKSRNYLKQPGRAKLRSAMMARRYRNDAGYRERIKAFSRLNLLLLPDSFIRRVLSIGSNKKPNEWTDSEVSARRIAILAKRSRRLNNAKAVKIRALAGTKNRFEIAAYFGVSPSLVWLVFANRIHHDPAWKPDRRIRSWLKTSAFFKMFDASEQLGRALKAA